MANPQMFVEVVASGGQAAVTVVGHGDNVGDAFGDDEDFVIVLNTAANSANAAITDVLVGTPVTPGLAANSAILSNTTASGDILFAVADASGNSQGLLHLDGSAGMLSVGEDATGYDVKFFGDTTGKYMLWDESEDDLIVIGDVGIGAGTGTGALTVTNTGSSLPTALLLRNLTAVGSANTGVNIVWHGNATGETMASQGVAWEGTDNADTYMAFETRTSGSPSEKLRIKSNGEVDLQGISTGGLINVGAPGNDWSAATFSMSSALSGGNQTISIANTSEDADSLAQVVIRVGGAGTSGDSQIRFRQYNGTDWVAGIDVSESSRWTLGTGTAPGAADAFRVTTSNIITFDNNQGANHDYVCDGCGRGEIEMFECCGAVAWHDDVLALRKMAINRDGLEHMAKLGVMNISTNNDGSEWLGINMQAAQYFTWSGMYQLYQRMDAQNEAMDTRLTRIEQALGV